jgi:type I restriction enzyme R subunit/putative DNA methylase
VNLAQEYRWSSAAERAGTLPALVPVHFSENYTMSLDCISVQPSRRLPHRCPPDRWLFVTWHLRGSLPRSRYPPPGKLNSGQAFVWIDRYLDTTSVGPLYLSQESIAKVVLDSLKRGVELGHYELRAWVVMGNHVHVLLLPLISPSRLLCSMKSATAREANRILAQTGETFWQAESYDHWVRDADEFERIVAYIESNPVKAGLVNLAQEYRWSSAAERAGRSRRGRLKARATKVVRGLWFRTAGALSG